MKNVDIPYQIKVERDNIFNNKSISNLLCGLNTSEEYKLEALKIICKTGKEDSLKTYQLFKDNSKKDKSEILINKKLKSEYEIYEYYMNAANQLMDYIHTMDNYIKQTTNGSIKSSFELDNIKKLLIKI